jgi:hypothetical protein
MITMTPSTSPSPSTVAAPASVVERVRKLLALAAGAANDHEAALAAQRAADLMARHALDEAMVRAAAAPDAPAPSAAPVRHSMSLYGTDYPLTAPPARRVAWHEALIQGVATSLGLRLYWRGLWAYAYGREDAGAAWRYLVAYLIREVDRLATAATPGDVWIGVRKYRADFRYGCAGRVAERLVSHRWETVRARRGAAERADAARTDGALVRQSAALDVVERDEREVAEGYLAFAQGFTTRSAVGGGDRGSGYAQGRVAGATVALGGGRGLGDGK